MLDQQKVPYLRHFLFAEIVWEAVWKVRFVLVWEVPVIDIDITN